MDGGSSTRRIAPHLRQAILKVLQPGWKNRRPTPHSRVWSRHYIFFNRESMRWASQDDIFTPAWVCRVKNTVFSSGLKNGFAEVTFWETAMEGKPSVGVSAQKLQARCHFPEEASASFGAWIRARGHVRARHAPHVTFSLKKLITFRYCVNKFQR